MQFVGVYLRDGDLAGTMFTMVRLGIIGINCDRLSGGVEALFPELIISGGARPTCPVVARARSRSPHIAPVGNLTICLYRNGLNALLLTMQ
jgi:hypothetical protein